MRLAWLLLCGAWGCSSVEGDECGALEPGTYRVRYVETSGDCGDGETLVQIPGDPDPPECSVKRTALNECDVALELECLVNDELTGKPIGAIRMDGLVTYRRTSASGTLEVYMVDEAGRSVCRGIQEATWTRL